MAALGEQDWNVWPAIREALERIGDPAVEPLLAALRDQHRIVRRGAAAALGGMRGARVVEALVAALLDQDWNVRKRVAESLERLGWQPSNADERVRWAIAVCDFEAAAVQDGAAVEALVAALRDEYWRVRQGAAEALERLGWQPRNADERVRRAIAISDFGTAAAQGGVAVAPLVAALRERDPLLEGGARVRRAAVEALRTIGAPAVGPLLAVLWDERWGVRQGAAEALGMIGDLRAVEPLLVTLRDEDSDVRRAAAVALGAIRDARAVGPLVAALRDQDWNVQSVAAEALGIIGDARAAGPLVAAVLRDQTDEVLYEAAEALGMIGGARVIDPLVAALRSEDWNVRRRATAALETIGGPVVGPLVAALRDEDSDARWAAAEALRRIGGSVAQQALREQGLG